MIYFFQLIGIIAFFISAWAFLQSDTRKTYKILAGKNLLMALHWFGLGNPYMLMTELLLSSRNLNSSYAPKAYAIMGAGLFACIMSAFYYYKPPENPWDYIPLVSSSLWGLTVVFRDKIALFRISVVCVASSQVFYFSMVSFSFGALMEIILIISSIIFASARDLGILKPIQFRSLLTKSS